MPAPVVENVTLGGDGAGTNPLSVPLPSGITAGDLLVVFVANGNGRTQTTPSGWNAAQNVANGGVRLVAYWRIATGSEGSSLSVSLNLAATFNSVAMRISGHDPTTPINVSTSDNASNNITSPAVTTTAADCLVLRAIAINRDRTFTVPSGHTLQGTVTTGASCDASVASIVQASAGSTGTATWTVGGGAADFTVHITAAIAPSAGGGKAMASMRRGPLRVWRA